MRRVRGSRGLNGALIGVVGAVAVAATAGGQAVPEKKDVFAVRDVLVRLAEQDIWPGFDPTAYPLAVYDGEKTWLFGHPEPPGEFAESEGHPGVFASEGRHPAMRWNSNADIGGVTTATLLLTIDPRRSAAEEAALIVHETFHVYQRRQGWPWRPNELDYYTYPVTDAVTYRLTIVEDHALARAMESTETAEAARWAARAMAARGERLSRLGEAHRTYEHGNEVKEGTAFYLAHKVIADEADTVEKLLDTLPPDQMRWRPYATGGAICALLDRLAPSWRARFDAEPGLTLDALLAEELGRFDPEPVDFSRQELERFEEQASAAVAKLEREHAGQRARFAVDGAEGWLVSVALAAGDDPFSLDRWDPITLLVLGDGEVVHGKQLSLGCRAGTVTMVNPGFRRRELVGLNALTRVRAGHPVVGEITEVVFTGLAERPQVVEGDGRVRLHADGLDIELEGAAVRTLGRLIAITVPPATGGTEAERETPGRK